MYIIEACRISIFLAFILPSACARLDEAPMEGGECNNSELTGYFFEPTVLVDVKQDGKTERASFPVMIE